MSPILPREIKTIPHVTWNAIVGDGGTLVLSYQIDISIATESIPVVTKKVTEKVTELGCGVLWSQRLLKQGVKIRYVIYDMGSKTNFVRDW